MLISNNTCRGRQSSFFSLYLARCLFLLLLLLLSFNTFYRRLLHGIEFYVSVILLNIQKKKKFPQSLLFYNQFPVQIILIRIYIYVYGQFVPPHTTIRIIGCRRVIFFSAQENVVQTKRDRRRRRLLSLSLIFFYYYFF